MAIVRGNFAETLYPGFRAVFDISLNEAESVWQQIFNTHSSNKAWEEDVTYTGFEQFQPFGEMDQIPTLEAKEGFKTRYNHRKWGAGYRVSWEMIRDNQYNMAANFPRLMARSAVAAKEAVAMSVFNLGFSARVGGDGEPLFSDKHPLAGAPGGVQSNTFSTPTSLSVAALEQATLQMKRHTDDVGIFNPIRPAVLLIPDQLEYRAKEILQTDRAPYSADNTINTMRDSGLTVITSSYLTDPDDWFLLAPKADTYLNYFEREPLQHFMDDDNHTQSTFHGSWERYSFGHSHWYGTFGVQGS